MRGQWIIDVSMMFGKDNTLPLVYLNIKERIREAFEEIDYRKC